MRVATFTARSFAQLEDAAGTVAWHRWLGGDANPVFRVTASHSKLRHTGAIAERLGRATVRPSVPGGRDQLVVVRVVDDRFTISVDSSGEPLHRRGYRLVGAKAPVRETVAAAVLLASGWDPAAPLVDPFCGSGTIPIEAARMARHIAPGAGRTFAFADWPGFEPGTWASVAGEARARQLVRAPAAIVASDRDDGAVSTTVANAERAGVADDIEVARGAVSDLDAPPGGPGWLVTNPPWGSRTGGGGDLRNLYARIGQVAATRFAGWHIAMLVADRRLAAHSGLPLDVALSTAAGGQGVQLLAGEVPGPAPAPG